MSTPAVESPISGTAAVVQSDQNVRAIGDKTGAPLIRSGQRIGDTFTDSVVSSYSNLINAPLVFVVFAATVVVHLGEFVGQENGPLELLLATLIESKKIYHDVKILNILAILAIQIVRGIIKWKWWVLPSVTLMVPYMRKPSSKNLKTTALLILITILLQGAHATTFFLAQFWYLITEMRNPRHKFFLAICLFIVFFFSWVDIEPPAPPPTAPSARSGAQVPVQPSTVTGSAPVNIKTTTGRNP